MGALRAQAVAVCCTTGIGGPVRSGQRRRPGRQARRSLSLHALRSRPAGLPGVQLERLLHRRQRRLGLHQRRVDVPGGECGHCRPRYYRLPELRADRVVPSPAACKPAGNGNGTPGCSASRSATRRFASTPTNSRRPDRSDVRPDALGQVERHLHADGPCRIRLRAVAGLRQGRLGHRRRQRHLYPGEHRHRADLRRAAGTTAGRPASASTTPSIPTCLSASNTTTCPSGQASSPRHRSACRALSNVLTGATNTDTQNVVLRLNYRFGGPRP